MKQLALEAVTAGFYNIDVDTSTLVDLSKPDLASQQRLNYETCVDIAQVQFASSSRRASRSRSAARSARSALRTARSKSCARSWTASTARSPNGARRAPTGSRRSACSPGRRTAASYFPMARSRTSQLDLNTLARLSKDARERVRAGGSRAARSVDAPGLRVPQLPHTETAEIHLATNFQNMLFDHLPGALRQEIYEWLRENAKTSESHRHRGAVLLQDAQKGARAVQASAMGSA